MESRAVAWSQSVEHEMNMANLNHRRTGCGLSFIVLTVSSVATSPGICPFHHPAFLQRGKAFGPCRTHLHFNTPVRLIGRQPGVKGMIVILAIAKDEHQAWKVDWREFCEQDGSGNAVVDARTRDPDGHQQPQRVDQQMTLAPLDLLAAVIPALGTAYLGGLERLTVDAHGAGRGLTSRVHADLCAQGLNHL